MFATRKGAKAEQRLACVLLGLVWPGAVAVAQRPSVDSNRAQTEVRKLDAADGASGGATPVWLRPGLKEHFAQKQPRIEVAVARPTSAERATLANIQMRDGKLIIDANHAGLAEILARVATVGGIAVQGTAISEPVFGSYGPGRPDVVLTELLTGSGNNFMLVGVGTNGFPKQLILSGKASSPVQAAGTVPSRTAFTGAAATAGEGPWAQATPGQSTDDAAEGSEPPLGPGAIAHVPPNEAQEEQGTDDSGTRLQQNLQRLQKMQTQQQQNAPQ